MGTPTADTANTANTANTVNTNTNTANTYQITSEPFQLNGHSKIRGGSIREVPGCKFLPRELLSA